MADPSDAQLENLNTAQEVANYIGLVGASTGAGAELTVRGSFFRLLGLADDTRVANLGNVSEPDFDALVRNWRIGEPPAAPSLVQQGAAKMFWRIGAIRAGTVASREAVARIAQQAHELAVAQAKAAPPVPPPPVAAGVGKVKMSVFCNQTSDVEVDLLDAAGIAKCYANYKKVYHLPPEPVREATVEQLSIGAHFKKTKENPYWDYSLLIPFTNRLMKKVKLRGLSISPDGKFVQVELTGPPTFANWQESFALDTTIAISNEITNLGPRLTYEAKIAKFVAHWGPGCWPLIYQAESRMRGEQFLRLQRQAEAEKAVNAAHPYDPNLPWDYIFLAAARDSDFWKDELENPALQVVTKARSLGVALDTDAPIAALNQAQLSLHSAGGSGSAGSWEQSQRDRSQGGQVGGRTTRPPPQFDDPPSPPKRPKNAHNVTGSGDAAVYTTNRSGRSLCPRWQQDGRCTTTSQGGCDLGAHQCAKCLQRDHGASECVKVPKVSKTIEKSRGRGPGRGRGGRGRGRGRVL